MSLTGKDLFLKRKKLRFKKRTQEKRQRQKERRAGYLTDLGKFEELKKENLPRVFEMKRGTGPCTA